MEEKGIENSKVFTKEFASRLIIIISYVVAFLIIFYLSDKVDCLKRENQLLKTTISKQDTLVKLNNHKINILENGDTLYIKIN